MKKQGLYLTSFQQKLLRKNLQGDLRPEYRRRIEIMLLADAGQSKIKICQALGCSKETARYWIAQAKTGQAHNWNDPPRGRPKIVNQQYLNRLKELVNNDPRKYGYSFQRWTAQWLSKHLAKELGIEVSARHVNRLLSQMKLSLRSKSLENKSLTNEDATENFAVVIRDLSSVSAINCPEQLQFNFLH